MHKENCCGERELSRPHSGVCLAVRARFAQGSKQALTHLQ